MKKKILALVLCVAMLAIAIVGGTLAYFTDNDAKTNTFTMGKVDIELTEPNYQPTNDKLHVYPGQTYAKDPTITVASDSEDCYLVATVTITKRANLHALYANDTTGVKQDWGLSLAGHGGLVSGGLADYAVTGTQDTGVDNTILSGTMLSKDGKDVAFLTYSEDVAADTITYTFYFKQIHSANAVEVLFEEVNIPSIIDNGDIDGDLEIRVKAYAIQEKGFNNVYEAYAALVAQGY